MTTVANTSASRPLRVLHVVHDYYPVVGGSELLFRRIAEGLAARGHDVSVFTSTARSVEDFNASDATTFPAGFETINGVRVRRFPFRQFSPLARRALDAFSHLWSKEQWAGYGTLNTFAIGPHLPGLVRSAVRLAPDVIAATAAPFLPIYRAAAAARRTGRPIAVMPCVHPGDRWFVDNPALLHLLRTVDAVMALTPYEIRLLRALDVPADRLWLIGGGVSADAAQSALPDLRARFAIPEAEPIVLFCGRKEEGKGILDVLEAMVRLWQDNVPGWLVLAGASTEYSRNHLARMIARLPAEWKARLLVRDDGELTTSVQRLLVEPGMAAALGAAGRTKVLSRFTWDAVVDRAEMMFRTLAADAFARTP